jgi:hypothetical protein
MRAEDYPALIEGFALCGRYNLQEFFDQQIEKFDTLDNLKNKSQIDQDNEIDKEIKIFDTLSHAIIPAQDLIVDKISKNTPLYNKFCRIFNYVIDNNIDLNSQSSSFFTPQLHLDPFFQYCIHTDFMEPAIQNWILTYREHDHNANAMRFLISKKISISTTDTQRKYDLKGQEHLKGKQYYSNNALALAILYNANNVIPLLIAAKTHQHQIDENLLIKEQIGTLGVYLKAQSYEKNIPLHWAIYFHRYIALQALINAGIDINSKDSQGNTPLHLAAVINEDKAISILLHNGANLHVVNNANQTPWDSTRSILTQDLLRPIPATNNSKSCTIS